MTRARSLEPTSTVRLSAVHRLASNLGHTLALALTQKTSSRARAEKPGLLGRSCSQLASDVDRKEAFLCGRAAVKAAVNGHTEMMVTLVRTSREPYECETGLTNLEKSQRVRSARFPRSGSGLKPTTSGEDSASIRFSPLVGKLEF